MKLSHLFEGITSDIEIKSLGFDSRQTVDVFFALPGLTVDGHQFIDGAISKGAKVIVHSKELAVYQDDIIYVQVANVMANMHEVAQTFYDHPSEKITLYGLTGTNGKTTTAMMLYQILCQMDVKAGYVGTLGVQYEKQSYETGYTTPDIITTTKILSDMVSNGVTHVLMEVSSSALDLHRVDSLDFDYIAFTNLSHDHLDVHGDMESYFQAKELLFSQFNYIKALVNQDDLYGQRLLKSYPNTLGFSLKSPEAPYYANHIEQTMQSIRFEIKNQTVNLPMLGLFNVENALCAFGMLVESGFEVDDVLPEFSKIKPISGRQNIVPDAKGRLLMVDFAHSKDSIESVLKLIRTVLPEGKKLIAVTGSAGSRDKLKRPEMAAVCEQYADLVIITEDDRHAESLEEINRDLIAGFKEGRFKVIDDRFEALEYGIHLLEEGDALVVLGKGDDLLFYNDGYDKPWIGDAKAIAKIIA